MNPYELIPLFYNTDGNSEGEAFVRGVHTTAAERVLGRSVIIYWGSKVTDAEMDVPNNSRSLRHIRAGAAAAVLAMALLTDRRILITGVLSTRSIAYGVRKACQREGATLAFTYVNDDLKDRVAKIAADSGVSRAACDVASDDEIAALFDTLKANGARSTACCIRSRSRRAKRSPAISSTE
jgi:hypothetical protein